MKKKNYLLALFGIALTLLTFHNSFSQVTQEWEQRYNGTGNDYDYSYSMDVDDSGNVYVTGGSVGIGTGYDYATIKYNSAGIQQWVALYNYGDDIANSITLDHSGNVYVTGSSGNDYATVKYNSEGVQLWAARYDGPANAFDKAYSIVTDVSENVYITGRSIGIGGAEDYATIKYNSAGVQQWVARYAGAGNISADLTTSIAVDESGNVYVTCSYPDDITHFDYATIKYNSAGVQQWAAKYNSPGNGNDYSASMAVDNSGNVYVTGGSIGADTDYVTIKYNTDGVQQWTELYKGPGNSFDIAYSIALDNSGNVYVSGCSGGIGTGYDYATIKYNSSGIQQWVARYNGPENSGDIAYSITVDDSENVYVTGSSYGSGTNTDYATVKYNSSGIQQWVERYNGPGNSGDDAVSLKLDSHGNVYVTGSSDGSGTGSDFATIKYSQTTGINQISTVIPEQFSLSQNYPNPFNPKTIINYHCAMFNFVSLKVYDALGKEVATLVNEKQSPGTYQVEFDGSGLSSGVYFYRLTTDSFTDTKSMLLVK